MYSLQPWPCRPAGSPPEVTDLGSNPDDDRPVFDVILGNAIRLCGADTSALMVAALRAPLPGPQETNLIDEIVRLPGLATLGMRPEDLQPSAQEPAATT